MNPALPEVTVPARFCGPPESGNGGWVAGLLASHLTTQLPPEALVADVGPRTATVRLASPPPLDRPLTVAPVPASVPTSVPVVEGAPSAGLRLLDGPHEIARATTSPDLDRRPVEPVPLEAALAAGADYPGLTHSPFPTCFVCGPARDPQDALCLRAGPLGDGTNRYAAHWVPRDVTFPVTWASLDCPGGWASGVATRPMVLGTMTATIDRLPVVGEAHVVLAWARGNEGRKFFSSTALLDARGEVLARADATWISVNPEHVRPKGS